MAAADEAACTEQGPVAAPAPAAILGAPHVQHGSRSLLEVGSVLRDPRFVEESATPLTEGTPPDVLPPVAGG